MFRVVSRLMPVAVFPLREANPMDRPRGSAVSVTETSGLERLRSMYRTRELDGVSMELNTVLQTSLTGTFFGVCYGGFVRSRNAYMYFIENNQATIFKTTMDARKKLQDYVTVAFCKGAYEWGWRLGFFTGCFGLISTSISVYRGDTSILEYIVAGAVTGALYKVNLGLAATLVGAGLGASLSAVAGLLIIGILKLTGVTMDDIRASLYKIKESREYHFAQAQDKAADIKNDDLTRHHDTLVEQKGVVILEQIE